MAGDDDEVYDKPQRYAEDNRAEFNCTCTARSVKLKPT